jgi:transglutaminase-like putative cysteine protease
MLVAARHDDRHRIVEEDRALGPDVPMREYVDSYGNRCWRFNIPEGTLQVTYDALIELSNEPDPVIPDAPQTAVDELPDETIIFTLPSRHCQSDLLSDAAWELFDATQPGWRRVQAICDWIHEHIRYQKGSTATTSAADVYQARTGVCRDFAHMGVVFCRAMNIPARYVFGYLPDVGIVPPDEPMDFHAWFEAFVDGQWHTFDARHNVPRIGRIPIGRGRDAVDVAMATTYGSARLDRMEVWADEVDAEGQVLSGLNAGQAALPRRLLGIAR